MSYAGGADTSWLDDMALERLELVIEHYTDRDIQQLAGRLAVLEERAGDPLAPRPLRDRAAAPAAGVRVVIAQHAQAPGQHVADGEG